MLGLNIKAKAIKLPEENMEESLSDLEFVNIFETQSQLQNKNINKLDFMKMKNFTLHNIL